MTAVALASQHALLHSLMRNLVDSDPFTLVRLETTQAQWYNTVLPPQLDVFVVDQALMAAPEVATALRQRYAACEWLILLPQLDAACWQQLQSWQISDYVEYFDLPATATNNGVQALTHRLQLALHNSFEKRALRHSQSELRQKLSARDEVFALVGRATHDGLWEWDLSQNKIYFSPRWKQMLGFGATELSDQTHEWFERVHPEERDQLREEITVHLDRLTEFFQSQHRLRHKDGHYLWMISRGQALRDQAGEATKLVGSHTDITGQKLSEERLLHDALHDALTGLANNALLRDRLQRAAAYARHRPDYMYAVLFLDIDRFKNINDSLGYVEGDSLLVSIAERLRNCVRSVDLVARLGSDEFTILLDDIGERAEATRTAERLQRALALPFFLGSREIYASASIGIAISSDQQTDPYDLVRDADTAMYRAKTRKNGLYEVFDASMHSQSLHLLGIETSLRRALHRGEMRLHYQPIINLSTQKLVGFEALLRWFSQERGLVAPADFIPLAEDTGLIIPLGRWVLQEACKQMMLWRREVPEAAELFVSVNISARQFTQADLVQQVATVLQESGFSAPQLKLEITESLLIDNVANTAVMMQQLTDMQVRLCIDDFGTGYSSLSSLYQFPIHTLKVDRSFVGRLGTPGAHGEIVETIIMLAHNLGMEVIAEGIETATQLQNLQKHACDLGQGYLFSKPVAVELASNIIRGHRSFGPYTETGSP